ncbi:MAG: hypothetical protein U0Q18_35535 [Bryobacteraceae bacterium]
MPLRDLPVAVLVFLISTICVPAQTISAPPGPVQPAALTALNNAFRAAYADAKIRELSSAGPILIVSGDNFSLLRGGNRLEANVGVPIYDVVKTFAHIPLAIYVTLAPGGGALDEGRLKTLAELRKLIPPARESLDGLSLSAATLARQKQIAAASLAILDDVAGKHELSNSSLLAFSRGMAPLVMENVAEATRAQLDATHAQVSAWRRDLSPEEWNRLEVVIIGPHMPREGLVVTQYFLRLLHEPKEGRRVVYAESLWEEKKALDLLGTHLLDSSVGEAFFGDGMRMHRDLLGDAATQYLPHLLPE